MRVMTIFAGHLAFRHRHVRFLLEFGTLLRVTGLASLGDAGFLQQATGGESAHRIVAIAAGQLVFLVNGAFPKYALAAFMTGQALAVHLVDWRTPILGESDDKAAILCLLGMQRSGTMTSLANHPLRFVGGILPERPGVLRVPEVIVLDVVATCTDLLANVGGDLLLEC